MQVTVRQRSVVIGYVHGGMVHEPFMQSMLRLSDIDNRGPQILHSTFGFKGLYVEQNRNGVVQGFLENTDADWLWFVDTDIEFPVDTIYKMLEVANPEEKPIIAGLYFGHIGDLSDDHAYHPVPIWFMDSASGVPRTLISFHDGLQEIDGAGTGCMLIHRRVLEAFLPRTEEWTWFGRDLLPVKDKPYPVRMGEDLTFCKRVKAKGFKIYGLGSAHVLHHKSRIESIDSYLQGSGVKLKEGESVAKFLEARGAVLPPDVLASRDAQ